MADPNEWTDKIRRIDFVRLSVLVSERIAALRLYAENLNQVGGPELQEAICRDLVFPNVALLAQFIDSVNIDIKEASE